MLTRKDIDDAAADLARASGILSDANDQEMLDEAVEIARKAIDSLTR